MDTIEIRDILRVSAKDNGKDVIIATADDFHGNKVTGVLVDPGHIRFDNMVRG